MTMRLGVIGSSEGNGHPFSFSAIINGYDSDGMRRAGWSLIADYLDLRDPADFGIGDVRVTHAWCPDPDEAAALSRCAAIDRVVADPSELQAAVDGVLIARDDWENHRELAAPFLASGIPVFLDKPLSLDAEDVAFFSPFLERGTLMSCSGFRFAPELDALRAAAAKGASPEVLQGVGPMGWDRYAVHLLEPLLAVTSEAPVSFLAVDADHDAGSVGLSGGGVLAVHCLGARAPGFVLNVTTGGVRHEVILADRFTAFRRLLARFAQMVETQVPPIDPEATRTIMEVLMARGVAEQIGSARVPLGTAASG